MAAAFDAHRAGAPRAVGAYWVGRGAGAADGRVVVLDRFGDLVLDVHGEDVSPEAGPVAASVERHTRQRGPMSVPPSVWVLAGARLTEAAGDDLAAAALALAERSESRGEGPAAVVVGRQ